MLCPTHHREVHEGGVTLEKNEKDEIIAHLPNGIIIYPYSFLYSESTVPIEDPCEFFTNSFPHVSAENLTTWEGEQPDFDYMIAGINIISQPSQPRETTIDI
jgi:hypothetical protein